MNFQHEKYIKTVNKTIMDLAVEHVKQKEINLQTLSPINHVRLFKCMILPCELIGLTGHKETKSLKNNLERSCLMQRIPFPVVLKPSKKSLEH